MQFLSVIPEQVKSAAQGGGHSLSAERVLRGAAGPTTAVVSLPRTSVDAIASAFSAYGRQCQFSAGLRVS